MDTQRSACEEAVKRSSEMLRNLPTEDNWTEFERAYRACGARYYKIYYVTGKLNSSQDLTSSYVELFDAEKKLIATAPVFKRSENRVEGALSHLAGLRSLDLAA